MSRDALKELEEFLVENEIDNASCDLGYFIHDNSFTAYISGPDESRADTLESAILAAIDKAKEGK